MARQVTPRDPGCLNGETLSCSELDEAAEGNAFYNPPFSFDSEAVKQFSETRLADAVHRKGSLFFWNQAAQKQ
jgi:hypothetical protein